MRSYIAVLCLILAMLAVLATASGHDTNSTAVCPVGKAPVIDGHYNETEWSDARVITVQIEGNDADIYFKHDKSQLYVCFDIAEGHNSPFPDTRVYVDTDHDASDSPQTDDYQLYINPDNNELIERQGDGSGWQEVAITGWDGWYEEVDSGHWTTEYNITFGKIAGSRNSTTPLGLAFLVYGNTFGFATMWPDTADGDDPSTWGHMEFSSSSVPGADIHNVTLRAVSTLEVVSGKTGTFRLMVSNSGTVDETFKLSASGDGGPLLNLTKTSVTLGAGDTIYVDVKVEAPKSPAGGITANIHASSDESDANATHTIVIMIVEDDGGGGGDDGLPGFEAPIILIGLAFVIFIHGRKRH